MEWITHTLAFVAGVVAAWILDHWAEKQVENKHRASTKKGDRCS